MRLPRALLLALLGLAVLAAPWPAAADPPHHLMLPVAPRAAALTAPTATPLVPTATPAVGWRRSDVVLVFLQGLRTTSSSRGFDQLEAALVADGWSAGQMVAYSYTGGAWTAGGWSSFAYGCDESLEGVELSRQQLAATIDGIRAHLPAARFVLVGHSFGGLVALRHAAATGDPAIVGVVTVDAPLHGVGSGKSAVYDALPCGLAASRAAAALTVAMSDLETIYADPVGWSAYWSAAAGWLGARGVPVATVGNALDCVYWPSRPGCSLPFPLDLVTYSDDRWTQYVAGYDRRCDADAASWTETHGAALRAPSCLAQLTALIDQAARPR